MRSKPKVAVNGSEWHTWFAWHPVRISSVLVKGEMPVRWWVWWIEIERKFVYSYDDCTAEYREHVS